MASVVSLELPLHLLDAGESGTVTEIAGSTDLVVRLDEMGLHRGASVQMIRTGSPCIVEVNRQRYSIRIDDSTTVLVEVSR